MKNPSKLSVCEIESIVCCIHGDSVPVALLKGTSILKVPVLIKNVDGSSKTFGEKLLSFIIKHIISR